MSALPQRFPRASLVNQASMLDARIRRLMSQTDAKIGESEDRGLGIVTVKLARRLQTLVQASELAAELEQCLLGLE